MFIISGGEQMPADGPDVRAVCPSPPKIILRRLFNFFGSFAQRLGVSDSLRFESGPIAARFGVYRLDDQRIACRHLACLKPCPEIRRPFSSPNPFAEMVQLYRRVSSARQCNGDGVSV